MNTGRGDGAPRRASTRSPVARGLVWAISVTLIVAACSSQPPKEVDVAAGDEQTSTSGAPSAEPSEPAATSDGESATTEPEEPSDGASSSDGESSPVPPAESEAVTLCNLTREYVQGLYDNGMADDGAYLEIAALSLSDNLRVWRGLVVEYPDVEDDVERAQVVYDLWRSALDVLAEGDVGLYESKLAESEQAISQLPSSVELDEVECA